MDDRRFDDLARAAAVLRAPGLGRRALLAGLLGFLGTGWRAPRAAADCKKIGQSCGKGKDCCGAAACIDKTCACKSADAACGKACCQLGEICADGSDAGGAFCCPPARVCAGTCCPPDRVCVCVNPPDIPGVPFPDPDDLCQCRCQTGFVENNKGKCVCDTPCGGDCCDPEVGEQCCERGRNATCSLTRSDPRNCGRCGNRCKPFQECVDGTCRAVICTAAISHCVNGNGPESGAHCNAWETRRQSYLCGCFVGSDGAARCGSPWRFGSDTKVDCGPNCCPSCTTDAECLAKTGPGTFCARRTPECSNHCVGDNSPGFCVAACPPAT